MNLSVDLKFWNLLFSDAGKYVVSPKPKTCLFTDSICSRRVLPDLVAPTMKIKLGSKSSIGNISLFLKVFYQKVITYL